MLHRVTRVYARSGSGIVLLAIPAQSSGYMNGQNHHEKYIFIKKCFLFMAEVLGKRPILPNAKR
jgi:hypothetical protein